MDVLNYMHSDEKCTYSTAQCCATDLIDIVGTRHRLFPFTCLWGYKRSYSDHLSDYFWILLTFSFNTMNNLSYFYLKLCSTLINISAEKFWILWIMHRGYSFCTYLHPILVTAVMIVLQHNEQITGLDITLHHCMWNNN